MKIKKIEAEHEKIEKLTGELLRKQSTQNYDQILKEAGIDKIEVN